jgi:rod shape-determining protein MreC
VNVVVDTRRRRFLFVGLILLHLGAISHQVDGGDGLSLLQRAVFTLLSPLQRSMSAVVGLAEGLWDGYGVHRRTFEENRRLHEQVRQLEVLLQERSQLARESERLRELLELRDVLPLDTVVAEVVSRDGVPWFRSLTVDKGSADGISLNAPVLSSTGVVGRVIALGPSAARVQVLLDRDAGVGVVVERTRVAGVVSGQVLQPESGVGDLVLKYVPERADVVTGDVVVTSGFDRIYPRGLTVGRVSSVEPGSGLLKDIRVQPSARFDRLEEVLVVRGESTPLETPQAVQ